MPLFTVCGLLLRFIIMSNSIFNGGNHLSVVKYNKHTITVLITGPVLLYCNLYFFKTRVLKDIFTCAKRRSVLASEFYLTGTFYLLWNKQQLPYINLHSLLAHLPLLKNITSPVFQIIIKQFIASLKPSDTKLNNAF